MGEIVKVQKSGKDLIVTLPTDILEKLNIEEGSEVDIEHFICGGESGIRMRPKK